MVNGVGALEHGLSGFQAAGQFRPDFDPHVMAIAIRAAIEAASPLLSARKGTRPPELRRLPDLRDRQAGEPAIAARRKHPRLRVDTGGGRGAGCHQSPDGDGPRVPVLAEFAVLGDQLPSGLNGGGVDEAVGRIARKRGRQGDCSVGNRRGDPDGTDLS